jgi:hypothetical protein
MTGTSNRPDRSRRAGAAQAASSAHRKNSVHVSLPVVGGVDLPPPDQMAFVAGVGLLAAFEVIEWPVAVVLAVGHALASSHRNRLVREFGRHWKKAEGPPAAGVEARRRGRPPGYAGTANSRTDPAVVGPGVSGALRTEARRRRTASTTNAASAAPTASTRAAMRISSMSHSR